MKHQDMIADDDEEENIKRHSSELCLLFFVNK